LWPACSKTVGPGASHLVIVAICVIPRLIVRLLLVSRRAHLEFVSESVDGASELMCCFLMSVIAGVGFARARFMERESRAPRQRGMEVNSEGYLPELING
jgi:hypothetical protein